MHWPLLVCSAWIFKCSHYILYMAASCLKGRYFSHLKMVVIALCIVFLIYDPDGFDFCLTWNNLVTRIKPTSIIFDLFFLPYLKRADMYCLQLKLQIKKSQEWTACAFFFFFTFSMNQALSVLPIIHIFMEIRTFCQCQIYKRKKIYAAPLFILCWKRWLFSLFFFLFVVTCHLW